MTDTLCTDDARGYIGGVRKNRWREAPLLSEVIARAGEQIQGKLLVGHGLQGDLKSLGLCHPAFLTRDTMNFSLFQSKGHARKLKSLAAELLGKKIQVHRHSAKCAPHLFLNCKDLEVIDILSCWPSVDVQECLALHVCKKMRREDAMAAMQLYLKYITAIEQDPDILLSYHLSLLTAAVESRRPET